MAVSEKSLKVRADIPRNRLCCTISGKITHTDMVGFFTDVRFGVADLKPGFDVITDLTNCHFVSLSAIPTFRKIMHYLVSKDPHEIIRVVNKKSMIFMQAINIASRIQAYKPIYVNTLTEAEEHLDRSGGRNGLRFHLLKSDIVFTTDVRSSAGELIDISKSGCAVRADGDQPDLGQKVALKILLSNQKTDPRTFEFESTVVRLFDGGFAVTFIKSEAPENEHLWECLVTELRCNE